MSRGKLKFDWSVYSARRRVTIRQLFEQKIIGDYASYMTYCHNMSVVPVLLEAFEREVTPLHTVVPPADVALPAETLTATVWLAGTSDSDSQSDMSSSADDQKKKAMSKKKNSAPSSAGS